MILLNKFIFVNLRTTNIIGGMACNIGYRNNKLWISGLGFWKYYAKRTIRCVSDFPHIKMHKKEAIIRIDFDVIAYSHISYQRNPKINIALCTMSHFYT